jgi:hypothetical protein
MKKIKININRAPVSKEEIESKRNFESVLAGLKAFSKPFYQTRLFLNGLIGIAFTAIILFTFFKLEKEAHHANITVDDGYVILPEAKKISTTDSLQTQEFIVNVHKDTLIRTAKGARIKIPADALQSNNSEAVLLVKEAYSIEDIVRAGLTTKTGKDLLSSSGMFYIQAKDTAAVHIKKPLSVSIPTEQIDYAMQVYQGKSAPGDKIDWELPKPLKNVSKDVVSKGEELFKENCKSCHRLGEDAVGPDLAYIGRRRDFDWIVRFVQNNAVFRAGGGYGYDAVVMADGRYGYDTVFSEYDNDHSDFRYAICIYEKYKKSEMTAFPTLSKLDIKELCDYINIESEKRKLPYPDDELYICYQKCKTYNALISKLHAKKNVLKSKRADKIVDNGLFVEEVNQSIGVLQMPAQGSVLTAPQRKSLVNKNYKDAEYYQVEINTFGWYNIDVLTKDIPGLLDSKLIVTVDENYLNKFQLYLVLPSMKVYTDGGLLKDKKDTYGFYEDNGSIKLPQNTTAYVYMVGEENGQLLYASAVFQTQKDNAIKLVPELISKEAFNIKIKQLLNFDGMSVQAKDSKNAAIIRDIDKQVNAVDLQIKEAEKLKPTECDCNCGFSQEEVAYDSIATFK